MATNFDKLANQISSFLKINAEEMLSKDYKDDGTTFFLRLPNQLGIVIGFDEEGYLETSVRVRDSSYFVDDWLYVDEGSFVGLESLSQIDGIVKYFMNYVKEEEERADIIDHITNIMFGETMTEYSVEKKDGTRLTIFYNLRDMATKIIDENNEEITWNVDLDRLKEFYKDLKDDQERGF